ncbi:MAG: DUF3891 family protein [Verrucomicrobia bacterium]|nr:DUF3891 family protein [Verrucomicrobiota bacterium]MCH8514278.1 DUF3891 family protein [Kiritimatiellia bacterium]
MIRLEETDHWLLLPHQTHAALAGEFARHWKNELFSPPDPFAHVLDAVSRHDDSWAERDNNPELTPDGHPSAFSRELVGSYDAFEDIDLDAYLQVRGQATERAAIRDPYSAILISMHTVNLLTEQADLSGLSETDRALHAGFIEGQRQRQRELKADLASRPDLAPFLDEAHLQRAFEFLQACDSLSLLAGVDFPEPSALRHAQVTRSGEKMIIQFMPLRGDRYRLTPWPLDEPEVMLEIPYRRVPKSACASLETFRQAYAAAETVLRTITLTGEPV